MHRLLILAALVMIQACQPLPQPFQPTTREKGAAVALLPQSTHGVSILEVTGLPSALSGPLRAAVAQRLRDEDIPAAVDIGHRGAFLLRGEASLTPLSPQEEEVQISWFLVPPDGSDVRSFVRRDALPRGQSQRPTLPQLDRIARGVTTALLPMLSPTTAEAQGVRGVSVWGIDGAPGDGGLALKRALEFILRENGVPIVERDTPEALVVSGTVSLEKPVNGVQLIRLRWVMLLPDGSELGTVEQENQIPAGSLDKTWGEAAIFAAEGAFEGLA
ncbi:MAG: hypothetical protein ACOVKO_04515, partial [Elstera sp.]